MSERPIIFSAPMVRAILEGRKTQTRRVASIPAIVASEAGSAYTEIASSNHGGFRAWMTEYPDEGSVGIKCPYGVPGDRLWVRETYRYLDGQAFAYRADSPDFESAEWRNCMLMPRKASRITLEITDVRVQRLQEISEDDAEAEGVQAQFLMDLAGFVHGQPVPPSTHRNGFRAVWNDINGKKAPWESNPWVWALTFRKAAQ